jgi:hypothetical protein
MSQKDRDTVRDRIINDRYLTASDFAKHCQFLKSINDLSPEDIESLRTKIAEAEFQFDKIQALQVLSQITTLSESEMRFLRTVLTSDIVGRDDKRLALTVISSSGLATKNDASEVWNLLIEGVVVIPEEKDAQNLAAIPGAKQVIRDTFEYYSKDADPLTLGTFLYWLAALNAIELPEITKAEELIHSMNFELFRRGVAVLNSAHVLAQTHVPDLRSHLAEASSSDRIWLIRLISGFIPIDVTEINYLFYILEDKDALIRIQSVELLQKTNSCSDPRVIDCLKRLVVSGDEAAAAYKHLIDMNAVSSQIAEDLRASSRGNFQKTFLALGLLRQSHYANTEDLTSFVSAYLPGNSLEHSLLGTRDSMSQRTWVFLRRESAPTPISTRLGTYQSHRRLRLAPKQAC